MSLVAKTGSRTADVFHNMLIVQKFRDKKNAEAASARRRWAEENEPGRGKFPDYSLADGRVRLDGRRVLGAEV